MSRWMVANIPHPPPKQYASMEDVLIDAARHARERLEIACEVMVWVSRLRRKWKRSYTPSFKVVGDPPQDGRAGDGRQAAHKIPGYLFIDDKEAWMFGSDEKDAGWLLGRLAVTEAVNTSLNGADSAAEASGLRDAFCEGCRRAWSSGASDANGLIPIFRQFIEDADRAFQRAHAKKHKRRIELTSELQRAKADSTQKGKEKQEKTQLALDDRKFEMIMLEAYRLHGLTAPDAARAAARSLAEYGLLNG